MSGWLVRCIQVTAGLAVGLALAEAGFWLRDDGAFPHVKVYVADPELGVRLRPGASQRLALGVNPVTNVRINAQGYRGADWGPPGDREVLIVGDSQVMGLGVEEHEAAAARLSALTGRVVLNGGVPTYGPDEYAAVVAEVLAERPVTTVVAVVNFSNDLFEAGRPNVERHAVWDGWAVRIETAPDAVTAFPGRALLFNRSHAVYALRRWLHQPAADAELGFPSEGSWEDVLAARDVQASGPESEHQEQERLVTRGASGTASSLIHHADDMARLLSRVEPELLDGDADIIVQAVGRGADPGDIVRDQYIEAARSIRLTAEQLREGARIRRELVPRLERWAAEHPQDPRVAQVRAAIDGYTQARARLDELAHQASAAPPAHSPLAPWMERLRDLCAAHGAELVVVALPLDVQVSPEEWAKYGEDPIDLVESRVLLTDLVAAAHARGIRALDAIGPLAAAQPGAFLHGDLHMTPKGHDALAHALVDVLAGPAPVSLPSAGLPNGRSRVPTLSEWALVEENTVRGSSRNRCITKRIREWQRVSCVDAEDTPWVPLAVRIDDAPLEAMAYSERGHADLVAPILPGRPLAATFWWAGRASSQIRSERLTLSWVADAPTLAFEESASAPPTQAGDQRLRACFDAGGIPPADRFGSAEAGCADAFPSDCDALIACARGERSALPACGPGQIPTGATGHCFALCAPDRPCDNGVCTPWQGSGVCL